MDLLIMFCIFFVLLMIGMPIVFVIGTLSFGYLVFIGGIPLTLIPQRVFMGIDKYPLMAIPFFILAGEIMIESKIINSIIDFADTLVGHLKGGLAHANIVANFIFAGISGSALADAAGLGTVTMPMMTEKGYPKGFSAAVNAAAAIMGPIVPPSVTFVVYALVAQNVGVTALLMAGFVPGALIAITLMIYCYVVAVKKKFPLRERMATLKEILIALKKAALPLFMPFILLGGMLGGIFTATEAAAVAAGYGLFVATFVLRKLPLKSIPGVFLRTALTTSGVFWIMATANVLTWILASMNLAPKTEQTFLSISHNPLVFLFMINILFLILGCLLESASAIIIFVPILAPLAINVYGIHPVHFGVVVVVNLMIGLLTPPVGLVLYVMCNVAKISLEELIREVWPFVIVETVVLLLITYFPWLVLVVPRLFGLA
jgi:tripartite ATP-independent transporter DctM subunit